VDEGATVVAVDQQSSADSGMGTVMSHDVRSRLDWATLLGLIEERHGRLDILVNSAGILRRGTVADTSLADWRQVLDVNLTGLFLGCQSAIRLLRRSPSAAIINISSVSGLKGDADLVAYDASKGAVCGLTKDIALYCIRQGYNVRCNSVHPGVVSTNMLTKFFEGASAGYEEWITAQPNGRAISPDEVAAMIAFLASDGARSINGAEFIIDGGATA
jgi:NAD(P)-dependent dehydrogenase (short-subunit alcohol dehydrogenase family)